MDWNMNISIPQRHLSPRMRRPIIKRYQWVLKPDNSDIEIPIDY